MSMEPLQILFILAVFCAPAAAVGCGLLAWALWRARCEAARSLAAASAMGRRLAVAEKKVEAVARLASDQARRVASLESRLPRKRLGALPESADKPKSPAEASITERRHRVLALSRRGMSAELIAQTLGVPHGEVELIISLNLLS